MENEQPKYTTIIHKVRINLELSCNEYCIADIIFCLSNNPANKVGGWCYASKETIGGFLGISKQTAHTIINNLIAKGLVEKDAETKYLRTTQSWYDKVVIERAKGGSKETLPPVKEVDSGSKETLLDEKSIPSQHSKETLHNNTNNNKDNTTFESFWASYPKKVNRKGAEKKWEKVDPKEYPLIFTALEAFKQSEGWKMQDGKFIPHPATWIYQERWKDELPKAAPKRPFYKGDKMQQFDGKWKVFEKGQWMFYGGKLSEIEWKS